MSVEYFTTFELEVYAKQFAAGDDLVEDKIRDFIDWLDDTEVGGSTNE